MAWVRRVTEMGMGVNVPGLDYTTADDMQVDVTIGVPKPEPVDRKAVLETLPHSTAHIEVIQGGLQGLNDGGADGTPIANAIVILDDGKERKLTLTVPVVQDRFAVPMVPYVPVIRGVQNV